MNALKTLLVGLVLLTAAYGVYMAVTSGPPSEPPSENAKTAETEIIVEEPARGTDEGATTIVDDGEEPFDDAEEGEDRPAPKFNKRASPRTADNTRPGRKANADPFAQAPKRSNHQPPAKAEDMPEDVAAPEAKANADESLDIDIDVEEESAGAFSEEGEDGGNVPTNYETPRRDAADFAESYAKIEKQLERRKLAEAQLELSKWYDNEELSDDEFERMIKLLEQLTGTIMYSNESHLEKEHVVKRGETLADLADDYDISPELLANINGLDPQDKLRAGDKLKVLRGPFDATIELDGHLLTLWLGERYAGRFTITIGSDAPTAGKYAVKEKVAGSERVRANDARQAPQGELALRLDKGMWIYGSSPAARRGDERGGIQLSPEDMQYVYDILSVGSKVSVAR